MRVREGLLSIDMKTKVRVSERGREGESERVTFEHRHENKSCSACPKDQHDHLADDT